MRNYPTFLRDRGSNDGLHVTSALRHLESISYNQTVRTRPRSVREWLLTTEQETRVALTCASCGNDQNFLVKTLQMHVVHLDDSRVEVSEEGRPAVLEVLCDECENPLQLEDMDAGIRRELLLTIGAR
jgi:hypothetical protein